MFNGLKPGKDGKMPKIPDAMPKKPEAKAEMGGDHSELHDHGDGTAHTVIGGAKEDHADMGHALMHLASHHIPGEKHVHTHSNGGSFHSHTMSEHGEHGETMDHASGEEAGQHAGNYLAEGGQEQPQEQPEEMSFAG